ncbi:MAG: hypothetical protein U0872_09970 [Planctomycetaceae bacterium]
MRQQLFRVIAKERLIIAAVGLKLDFVPTAARTTIRDGLLRLAVDALRGYAKIFRLGLVDIDKRLRFRSTTSGNQVP